MFNKFKAHLLIKFLLLLLCIQLSFVKKSSAQITDTTFSIQPGSVKLLMFEAHPLPTSIMIRWATFAEKNMATFELQRAPQSVDFVTIEKTMPTGVPKIAATYHFTDENVRYGQSYNYRLKMTDSSGTSTFSKTITVALDEQKGLFEATNYAYQTATEINYELTKASDVKLEVFNNIGIYQKTIVNTYQVKGMYQYTFSAKENNLPPGMYCIRMIEGKATYSKMVSID